jgi:hypothetical protein
MTYISLLGRQVDITQEHERVLAWLALRVRGLLGLGIRVIRIVVHDFPIGHALLSSSSVQEI